MAGRETPAVRAAKAAGIAFELHEYAHDPRADSYGVEAVEALGLDAARVFKTLVVDAAGTLTVCVVPAAAQLDLGALGKRAAMAPVPATSRAGSPRSASGGRCPRWWTTPRAGTQRST